jgi:Pyruvate/2-oxoacid:ferredoxin oxidoreductase gamma subunit
LDLGGVVGMGGRGLASLAEWWAKAVRDKSWRGRVVGGRGLASLAEWWAKAVRDKSWRGRVVGGRGLEPLTSCV